jgi:predicted transcriptional regulator of viral defense system
MTLRSQCEALVRELSGPSIEASDRLADYCAGQDDVIKRLQAALDATADEGLDADILRFAMVAARLLQGFMLDTNNCGVEIAGRTLAVRIKEYLK